MFGVIWIHLARGWQCLVIALVTKFLKKKKKKKVPTMNYERFYDGNSLEGESLFGMDAILEVLSTSGTSKI
jgi:hypothetical protein